MYPKIDFQVFERRFDHRNTKKLRFLDIVLRLGWPADGFGHNQILCKGLRCPHYPIMQIKCQRKSSDSNPEKPIF